MDSKIQNNKKTTKKNIKEQIKEQHINTKKKKKE